MCMSYKFGVLLVRTEMYSWLHWSCFQDELAVLISLDPDSEPYAFCEAS